MASKRRTTKVISQEPVRTEHNFQTIAFVQRQYFEGKEESSPLETKNEPLKVHRFLTDPAKVSVAMGLTLNLGNYESCRLEVALTVPCYREEADSAYEYAKGWVESRLGKEVDDVRLNKPKLFKE